MLAKQTEPLRFGTKDKSFVNRRHNLRGRTLKIAHHYIGVAKHRIYTFREQTGISTPFYVLSHPSIEQNIACKDYAQRVCCRHLGHKNKAYDRHSYKTQESRMLSMTVFFHDFVGSFCITQGH